MKLNTNFAGNIGCLASRVYIAIIIAGIASVVGIIVFVSLINIRSNEIDEASSQLNKLSKNHDLMVNVDYKFLNKLQREIEDLGASGKVKGVSLGASLYAIETTLPINARVTKVKYDGEAGIVLLKVESDSPAALKRFVNLLGDYAGFESVEILQQVSITDSKTQMYQYDIKIVSKT